MQPAVYGSNPASSISELSPFPEAVVVLILAWLATIVLTRLWERSRNRSRLPAVLLAVSLLCACTSTAGLPGGSYGVWRTGPNDEPITVTIWRSGKAFLRLDGETLELRK